jgi:hypothetical protein
MLKACLQSLTREMNSKQGASLQVTLSSAGSDAGRSRPGPSLSLAEEPDLDIGPDLS